MESLMSVEFAPFMERRQKGLATLASLLTQRGMETTLLEMLNLSRSREKFLDYFEKLLNLLSLFLRDLMILKIEDNSDYIINIDYKENLMQLRGYISVDRILFLIRKMEFLLRDIKRNLNTKVLILEFIKSYTDEGQ